MSLLRYWVRSTPCLLAQEASLTLPAGAFTILYGLVSVKIKQKWYLGEALPALVVGIILGPVAAKFIDSERWGSAVKDQTEHITLVSVVRSANVNSTRLMVHLTGHHTDGDWCTAGHGWLPAARKIPLAPLEGHDPSLDPSHDDHVALHHRLYQTHDPEADHAYCHGHRLAGDLD
jgi:hypothetical protein